MLLLPVGWETDVAPEMGDHPQAIINQRLLQDADFLVGIFWTRLGTPTASYASGAVEEIETHLAAGKPAMLYFSAAPAALDALDPDQHRALKAFKDACRSRGLCETYLDAADFRRKFSKQLQIAMNTDSIAPFAEAAPSQAKSPQALSTEAARMLKAASLDGGGAIYRMMYGGGAEFQANGVVFNADSSARTIALWESAIEELELQGLVKAAGTAREVFEVTRTGFAAADAITE
jgi:hypothetical protein